MREYETYGLSCLLRDHISVTYRRHRMTSRKVKTEAIKSETKTALVLVGPNSNNNGERKWQSNILERVFTTDSLAVVLEYLQQATSMATSTALDQQRLELPESFYETQKAAMQHSVNLAIWFFLVHVHGNIRFREYVIENALQHCREPRLVHLWVTHLATLFSRFILGHATDEPETRRIVNIVDFVMRARRAYVLI